VKTEMCDFSSTVVSKRGQGCMSVYTLYNLMKVNYLSPKYSNRFYGCNTLTVNDNVIRMQ
jgi:hypothetical protein